MNFKNYVKENLVTLLLVIFPIITIEIILMIYNNISNLTRIYIFISIIIAYFLGIYYSYYKRKNYYNKILNILKELDKKYLISEMTGNPNFIEGKILKEILQETSKSMTEHVNEFKFKRRRLQRIYRTLDT